MANTFLEILEHPIDLGSTPREGEQVHRNVRQFGDQALASCHEMQTAAAAVVEENQHLMRQHRKLKQTMRKVVVRYGYAHSKGAAALEE